MANLRWWQSLLFWLQFWRIRYRIHRIAQQFLPSSDGLPVSHHSELIDE